MNHYWHVFFENIWAASIIPMASEPTFMAMKAFGGYNLPLAAAIGIAGATVGHLLNWAIGLLLLKLQRKGVVHISDYWLGRTVATFNKYCAFLLLLNWLPVFGTITVILSGFVGLRLRFVLPLIVAGQALRFGFYFL